jgi:hypothetical protein
MGRATSQPGPGWALVRRSSPEKLPVSTGRAVTEGIAVDHRDRVFYVGDEDEGVVVKHRHAHLVVSEEG